MIIPNSEVGVGIGDSRSKRQVVVQTRRQLNFEIV